MKEGTELSELFSRLNQELTVGLRSQRMIMKNRDVEYVDPEMTTLSRASKEFEDNPNSDNFRTMREAVLACQGSEAFDWKAIKDILTRLDKVLQESRKAKP